MRKLAYSLGVIILLLFGLGVGYGLGQSVPKEITIKDAFNRTDSSAKAADFSTFWEAWQVINDRYLKNDKVGAGEKMYGATRGLVASLGDPYTEFFSPEESHKFEEDVQGNFGGIGAELGIRKERLVVIAPLKNTPAMRAGLVAGDYIVSVNSSSTDGVAIDKAVSWIRGERGTKVKLLIFRESWDKPKEIEITRDNIEVPTLDWEMRGETAYIQLYSFNANATSLFYDAVMGASKKGARAIVLDLRNDPGGYLQVAVDLAGWFLPKGTLVVSEEGRTGSIEKLHAQGNEALVNMPIVLLLNQGSASASEILAGALRDQRKIKLVGEKSFGKGTVQEMMNLHDGSSMKVTIAHWVLPSGKILEDGGLVPDVEVKLTDQDIENKKDSQLEKALELAKNMYK